MHQIATLYLLKCHCFQPGFISTQLFLLSSLSVKCAYGALLEQLEKQFDHSTKSHQIVDTTQPGL